MIKDQIVLDRLAELSKRENDIPLYLYQSGRCAVAHAYSDPMVDPDDVVDLRRLSQDLWIIKAIAEELMTKELKISKTIKG